MKRYYETVDTILDYVPMGHEKVQGIRVVWPLVLVAMLFGLSIEMMMFVIREIRRNIYNRNRNLTYAKKNQPWRTKAKNHHKVPLPAPPGFAEDLQKQWNKVHDSLDEMLKFGRMLVELEDYVDNSFISDNEDNIVGRMPGMKGFLAEHCPYIGYKTAMRYRTLALKAQEVESKGKTKEIQGKYDTVCELTKRLDKSLGVVHRRLKPHRRPRRCRAPDNPIFSLREQTHSALSKLDTSQRQQFVSALQELVREISVS